MQVARVEAQLARLGDARQQARHAWSVVLGFRALKLALTVLKESRVLSWTSRTQGWGSEVKV